MSDSQRHALRSFIGDPLGVTVFALLAGLSAVFFGLAILSSRSASDDGGGGILGWAGGNGGVDGGGVHGSAPSGEPGGTATEPSAAGGSGETAALAAKLRAAETEIARLKSDADTAARGSAETKGALSGRLTREGETLRSEKAALAQSLDEIAASRDTLQGQLDVATRERVEVDGQLNLEKQNAAAAAAGFAAAAEKNRAELDTLKARLAELEKKLSAADREKSAAATEAKKALDAAAAGWNTEKGKLVAENATLKKQADDLQKQVAGFAGAMPASAAGALKTKVSELEKKLADSAAARDDLAKKLAAAAPKDAPPTPPAGAPVKAMAPAAGANDPAALEKALAPRIEAAKKRMTAQLQAARQSAEKAAAETAAMRTRVTALDAEKGKLAAANQTLQQRVADLEGQVKTALAKADAAAKSMAAATAAPGNGGASPSPAAAGQGAGAGSALAPLDPGMPALDLPHLINDPNALSAGAKPLFAGLRQLGDDASGRETAYDALAQKLGAEIGAKVNFRGGSNYVNAGAVADLKKLAASGGKYLVIGYASTDGSKLTNHRLSSERASEVAKVLTEAGAKASVEAIYLGETSRFGGNQSANRLVEVWRVK
ncbi:MAG: OmpA family protein [Verrucomicrobiae bacterium]|nr:OmpA family protein [Verrucomicrobiae bacterium]